MGAPGVEAAEKTEPSGNGHVGRALRRKEDPRLITGRATYVDDMVLPGMLFAAIVRSPEAHARILSIDTEAAKARPEVEAVFTGEDMADMAAPCPMVWVPPGVEMRVPDHWPLARGKVGYVGQAVAVVLGTDKYGVVDAAEDVIVEYDPLPVVTDPEAALEDGAPVIHEEFGSNKVFEWSLARRRRRGRVPRRRRRGREADRQPPHGRRGDRAARRARRVAPGQAVALELDADPAHRARDPVDPARHHRGQDPRRGARGRRRLRLQAAGLRRGGARLLVRDQDRHAGQVDGDAHGRDGRDPPRARPDRLHQDRSQARRDRHRHPREDHPGLRQLPPDRGPGHPDVQLLRDRRLLQVRRRPDRHRRRVHEQVHDRRDPGRGPARGDPHDRAHDGRARRRARHGQAGAAAQELHHGVPVRAPARLHLRLRQLPRDARPLPGEARPRRVPARAGRAARPRRSTAASASRPTSRSAASGRRARSGRRAGACRAATSSRRRCACTRPGR